MIPALTLSFGLLAWQGTDKVFGLLQRELKKSVEEISDRQHSGMFRSKHFQVQAKSLCHHLMRFILLMPTSMPHSSIEKNLEYIETLDKRLSTIPEVQVAVGKWGRVNSALDPAPIQMFENTINYRSEYILDENGHRMQFKVDRNGSFILKTIRSSTLEKKHSELFLLIVTYTDYKGDFSSMAATDQKAFGYLEWNS